MYCCSVPRIRGDEGEILEIQPINGITESSVEYSHIKVPVVCSITCVEVYLAQTRFYYRLINLHRKTALVNTEQCPMKNNTHLLRM